MDNRFDDLLHTIIVQKGQGLYGFFDVLYSFLYRKTDFYYEMAPGENMGFFPGQAEALVNLFKFIKIILRFIITLENTNNYTLKKEYQKER